MKSIGKAKEETNAMRIVLLIALAISILLGLLITNVSCTRYTKQETLNLEYQVDLSQLGNGSAQQIMATVFEVISLRVADLSNRTAVYYRDDSNMIQVALAGITDLDTADKLITTRGSIDFREMLYDSYGNPVLDSNGNYTWVPAMGVFNCEEEQLTGQYVKYVKVITNPHSDYAAVVIDFNPREAILLEQITKRLFVAPRSRLNKSLGVFCDGQLLCNFTVEGVLSDECSISALSLEQARNLAAWLKSGPLPVPVNLVSSTLTYDDALLHLSPTIH